MKNLKFFATLAVAFFLSICAMAQKLTNEQQAAQKAVLEYLRSQNYSPSIDTKDQSVNFKDKGVLHWVTFEEISPILYTLHIPGINFDNSDNFVPEVAAKACAEVNANRTCKAYVNGNKIEFVSQMYAKNPSDFCNALRKNIASFDGCKDAFKASYESNLKQWKKNNNKDNTNILPGVTGPSTLIASKVSFASYDTYGNVTADFDKPIRHDNCFAVGERVTVRSSVAGLFKIGVRIYGPDKKLILSQKGAEYSISQNFKLKKKNRDYTIDVKPFGANGKPWEAGEYRVEIYDFETGVKLQECTFHVL